MRDYISEQLNKPMTRRQFLQMSGAMLLSVIGLQNIIQIFMKHTSAGSTPVSLLTQSGPGFGSRKFGE